MKTIFITGASSGIGKEIAKLFQQNGWNVIATMRKPELETELGKLDRVKLVSVDVTNVGSIRQAISQGIASFGGIDVLVNNAGYYILGPLESASHEQIRQQIDTNLIGLIDVTKEMVPYFRKQRSGCIINLSSIAGVVAIPLQSLYHAAKWGVEGFSESLQYELRPYNIRVKLIEPGTIKTDFLGRSMTKLENNEKEYQSYVDIVTNNIFKSLEKGSAPKEVAQTIWKAATDNKFKLRYPTGYLKELTYIRSILPKKTFFALMRNIMEKQ